MGQGKLTTRWKSLQQRGVGIFEKKMKFKDEERSNKLMGCENIQSFTIPGALFAQIPPTPPFLTRGHFDVIY